jgi:hypothetical protein
VPADAWWINLRRAEDRFPWALAEQHCTASRFLHFNVWEDEDRQSMTAMTTDELIKQLNIWRFTATVEYRREVGDDGQCLVRITPARALLRDLLEPIEGSGCIWTEDSRERDALRIRAVLGLCQRQPGLRAVASTRQSMRDRLGRRTSTLGMLQ